MGLFAAAFVLFVCICERFDFGVGWFIMVVRWVGLLWLVVVLVVVFVGWLRLLLVLLAVGLD